MSEYNNFVLNHYPYIIYKSKLLKQNDLNYKIREAKIREAKIWKLIIFFRFINRHRNRSEKEIHELSCLNNGDEDIIIENHQFMHVELEKYWLDNSDWMANLYANFFLPVNKMNDTF